MALSKACASVFSQPSTASAVVSICRSRPPDPVMLVCVASSRPSSFWAFSTLRSNSIASALRSRFARLMRRQREEIRIVALLRLLRQRIQLLRHVGDRRLAALSQSPDDVGVGDVLRRPAEGVDGAGVPLEAALAVALLQQVILRPRQHRLDRRRAPDSCRGTAADRRRSAPRAAGPCRRTTRSRAAPWRGVAALERGQLLVAAGEHLAQPRRSSSGLALSAARR